MSTMQAIKTDLLILAEDTIQDNNIALECELLIQRATTYTELLQIIKTYNL